MLNGCGALLGACVTGILSISFGFGAGLLAGAARRAPRFPRRTNTAIDRRVRMHSSRPRALLAMGLVTMAVIVYEIALTRLLSVVLWYHFAFLSISLAMLGLGAPGVWFALRQRGETSETPGRIEARLAPALMFAGLAIPLSVLVIVRMRPIVLQALGGDAWVVSIVIAALVPLYALGYAVCALLIAAEGRAVGGMYAADLAGAACGALLVVFAMALLPAPRLLALAGL